MPPSTGRSPRTRSHSKASTMGESRDLGHLRCARPVPWARGAVDWTAASAANKGPTGGCCRCIWWSSGGLSGYLWRASCAGRNGRLSALRPRITKFTPNVLWWGRTHAHANSRLATALRGALNSSYMTTHPPICAVWDQSPDSMSCISEPTERCVM